MVALFPTQERELYIVKEAVPGTIPASAPGVPVPFTALKPSNKPLWLDDDSFQGSMGDTYGVYQGPLIAGYDIGGHIFGDTFGHFLYNLLGDYTATGTASSPTWTAGGGVAAGAGPITVTSGSVAVQGTSIQIGSGQFAEVVTVGAGSTATSIVVAATTPIRFTHTGSTTITTVVAPFTHVFSVLNGLVGAPYAGQAAQPPAHTITDVTGIPATGLADQYAYSCLSELTITGNAEHLFDWAGKAVCYTRQVPGSAVSATNVSGVQPYPSWRSAVGIGGVASGGTQVKNTSEWAVTLTRQVKAFNTNQGAQTPFAIGRGKLGVTGKNTFSPSIDDTALTNLLNNVQPQLEYIASNGLGGASLVSCTIDIGLGAHLVSDINDGAELFGYDTTFKAPHTAASFTCTPFTGPLTGASGGKSAIKITLVNAVPTY